VVSGRWSEGKRQGLGVGCRGSERVKRSADYADYGDEWPQKGAERQWSGVRKKNRAKELAAKMRKSRKISVSFFGDGATNEGVLYESMNFAALKKLPIIFVCENNYYATHMPIGECRPDVPIFEIAKSFGIESRQVDGNDVLAVYEVAKEAVGKCRAGEGPAFLECLTYRLRGHVGPNDNIQGVHTDIRPVEEVEEWGKKDPIVRFERYLLENGVMGQQEIVGIKTEVEREVEEAFAFARGSAFPEAGDLGNYVYAE